MMGKRRATGLALFTGGLAVAAIASWLAVGLSSETTSAQELLESAQERNGAVETYRYTM